MILINLPLCDIMERNLKWWMSGKAGYKNMNNKAYACIVKGKAVIMSRNTSIVVFNMCDMPIMQTVTNILKLLNICSSLDNMIFIA